MLEKLESLLASGTIKGLIVATVPLLVLLASLFGVDEAVFRAQLEGWAEKLLLILSLLAVAWAAWQRALKPTPPLTDAAKQETILRLQKELAEKGQQLTVTDRNGDVIKTLGVAGAAGVGPMSSPNQKGFARVAVLIAISVLSAAALSMLSGCQHTRDAYASAETFQETAYVISEHYAILRERAADLKDSGSLSPEQLDQLQQIDLEIEPLVVGAPNATPARPGLIDLARSEPDPKVVQLAINTVIEKLTNLSKLIKSFGGNVNGYADPSADRPSLGRPRVAIEWSGPRLRHAVSIG